MRLLFILPCSPHKRRRLRLQSASQPAGLGEFAWLAVGLEGLSLTAEPALGATARLPIPSCLLRRLSQALGQG